MTDFERHKLMFDALGQACMYNQIRNGCIYNKDTCVNCYIEKACKENVNEFLGESKSDI